MRPNLLLPASLILALTASIVTLPAAEPTGASAAFTSRDAVVLKALDRVKSGKFQQAEALLRASDRQTDPEALRARTEALEIIHRTRYEYSLAAPELLSKVRNQIPDATALEIERWARDSAARYRIIDGKKFFARREPSNIFLFCEEAKARLAPRPATLLLKRTGSSPTTSRPWLLKPTRPGSSKSSPSTTA